MQRTKRRMTSWQVRRSFVLPWSRLPDPKPLPKHLFQEIVGFLTDSFEGPVVPCDLSGCSDFHRSGHIDRTTQRFKEGGIQFRREDTPGRMEEHDCCWEGPFTYGCSWCRGTVFVPNPSEMILLTAGVQGTLSAYE